MRPLRFATLGLVTVVALAGFAAAMHAHTNYQANVDDNNVAGGNGVDASTDGVSLNGGLATEHASADGSLSTTLPPLPEKPETPALPATADVPATPEVPEAPKFHGDGSADGSASTDHGSASGGVGSVLSIG